MRLHHIIEGMNRTNDENLSRPLLESIVAPEVSAALKQWIGSADVPGVLIGGLALSFYVKPRTTMDVDVLYLTDKDIPNTIPGFKRIRPHAFQHNQTHVEVEVLSAEHLKLPMGLANKVFQTAETSNGMKVASKSGLVALKLIRAVRENDIEDQGDIQNLLRSGNVDITPFQQWLDNDHMQLFQKIKEIS